MNLFQFNQLSELRKHEYILDIGIYLTSRNSDNFHISLFTINNFYCEVWYNKNKKNFEPIRSYRKINELDPYLEKIKFDKTNTY